MVKLEKVKSYDRRLPGRKATVKVRGYRRPSRKLSGKRVREEPKIKLGYIRDPKTGWIIGSYVIRKKKTR